MRRRAPEVETAEFLPKVEEGMVVGGHYRLIEEIGRGVLRADRGEDNYRATSEALCKINK